MPFAHSSQYNYDYGYWNLRHKVTFDGVRRLILINTGETAIDFERDIYSDWKEWVRLRENAQFAQALRTVGGDPLNDEGDRLGASFFLLNGWRIQSWDGDHQLTIFGNFFVDNLGGLYSDSGGLSQDPDFSDRIFEEGILPISGSESTILVRNSVSNLVDKINGGGGGGSFPTVDEIADAVWNKLRSDGVAPGSYGEKLKRRQVFVNTGDLIIDIDEE